ncbi:MAG: hypothetical protein LUQ16_06950 [Methanomassiliicoccales archaeon]|jgi:hypothetical protein|nr:hypothetical protein [Methanomassiliicoccales archaeon]MDD1756818.1 hypothetical protein [Methanomassiliicoccales archaeon]
MAPNKSGSKQVEEVIGLTKGSRYRIISKGSGDTPMTTVGVFKGYTAFGHDSALSMQLDPEKEGEQGLVRLVPCLTVLAIDIINFKPEEKVEEKEEVKIYFG